VPYLPTMPTFLVRLAICFYIEDISYRMKIDMKSVRSEEEKKIQMK
jgi:hypothetical protein